MTTQEFGKYLKNIRIEKKLKAKVVCENINLSQTMYSLYENGFSKPRIGTLKKLSKFFNIPYKEMYEKWKN